MPIEIKMPQLGESVTEGTVGRWLKQPGERVEKYEPLLEVITDKVDTEVPAPETGTLAEIVVAEGETVRVGTVLARLALADEPAEVAAPAAEAAMPVQAAPTAPAPALSPARPTTAVGEGEEGRNSYLSPVVARLVVEHGLDVGQIPGTGNGGRVTKQDVLRFVEQRGQGSGVGDRGAGIRDREAVATPTPMPTPVPAAPTPRSSPIPHHPSPIPEDAELVPLTPMRRMIAEHMLRSVRTSPHVTSVMEVDLSRVVAHRERHRATFERQGVRLTFTPYFVQAVVAAVQAAPVLNGSYSDEGIIVHRRIHIGVAVALDEGLIVPVVRDADEKNLLGLARTVSDLAERARTRRLKPDESQGGTFTITNHGTSGSLFATPIINQPQAGILGVGAIVKRPVVVTQDGVDAIAIKPIAYLSLTFDHRIADGALGDAFLMAAKRFLEGYSQA